MARFVHLTPERLARRSPHAGIPARSPGRTGERGVYCMPILASHTLTHQWTREQRRRQAGPLMAVDLCLPDNEPVTVGHYATTPQHLTAAQAVAMIRQLADPRGHEVFIPRAITPKEVHRVRVVRQGIGWRYQPDAHGRRPCACPSACSPAPTAPPACAAASTPTCPSPPHRNSWRPRARRTPRSRSSTRSGRSGGRRRGGAEELAYLADHPDPEVRDTLAEILRTYRGRAAQALRARLEEHRP